MPINFQTARAISKQGPSEKIVIRNGKIIYAYISNMTISNQNVSYFTNYFHAHAYSLKHKDETVILLKRLEVAQ